MDEDADDKWQTDYINAGYEFASQCKIMRDTNPHDLVPLNEMMTYVATELWDRGFSQTEIRAAFYGASESLVRYCAGEERRGDKA